MSLDKEYIEFRYNTGASQVVHRMPIDVSVYEAAQEFKLFLLSLGYHEANVKEIFPEDFV